MFSVYSLNTKMINLKGDYFFTHSFSVYFRFFYMVLTDKTGHYESPDVCFLSVIITQIITKFKVYD